MGESTYCAYSDCASCGGCDCVCHRPPTESPTVNVVRRDPGCECDLKTLDAFGCTPGVGCECYKCHLEADNAQREADNEALRRAIETHRRNVMLLGHRTDERTGDQVWGGQFDRDLWAVLGEGYPTESVGPDGTTDPSDFDEKGPRPT